MTVVEETGSTNADLAQLARLGAAHGTTILASHQAAGRGRFVRAWQDTPGTSIAMSVLLRPGGDPTPRWGWLSLVTGLGIADGLRNVSGLPVVLKWPNDLLLETGPRPGKLVGILSEAVDTPTGTAVVTGVGINVAMTEDELPVDTATSLLLAGADIDRTRVATSVLCAWSDWYARWAAGDDLVDSYREHCVTIGREVRVQLDGQRGLGPAIVGTATDVDADGSLLVSTGDGCTHAVAVGDVIHVRPAHRG